MYGYVYKGAFYPFHPSHNLIIQDDDECSSQQFGIRLLFSSNTQYTLLVTTHTPKVTGTFTIFASGPSNVTLERVGE